MEECIVVGGGAMAGDELPYVTNSADSSYSEESVRPGAGSYSEDETAEVGLCHVGYGIPSGGYG